jgi:tetratricopeptide (TPR) repeat protein
LFQIALSTLTAAQHFTGLTQQHTHMAFRIAAQQRRTTKLQQRDLAAFGDDNGEDEETPSTSDCAAFGAPAGDGRSGSTAVTTAAAAATVLTEEGAALAESGQFQAALLAWDRAAAAAPPTAALHEMRAQVLDAVGRSFEAVQAATAAVALDPAWAEARITLARAQLNLGEPTLALASFDAALRIAPGCVSAEELGSARLLAKRHAAAPPGTRAHVLQQQQATMPVCSTDESPHMDVAESAGCTTGGAVG